MGHRACPGIAAVLGDSRRDTAAEVAGHLLQTLAAGVAVQPGAAFAVKPTTAAAEILAVESGETVVEAVAVEVSVAAAAVQMAGPAADAAVALELPGLAGSTAAAALSD